MKTLLAQFVVAFLVGSALGRDAITVDPGTSGGTGGVDVAGAGLQNKYCETLNKECPGADLEPARFSPHIRDCMSRCNKNLKCLTIFYDFNSFCHLRGSRCSPDKLVAANEGADYYRLGKDEECPADRPVYIYKGPKYSNTFCMAWGKACKGYNIYPKPQNIGPDYVNCLKKCAKIQTCAGVDFYLLDGKPKCEPKDYMCDDNELVDEADTQNFLRLLETETECPSNRVPPAPTAPPTTPAPPPTEPPVRPTEPAMLEGEYGVNVRCSKWAETNQPIYVKIYGSSGDICRFVLNPKPKAFVPKCKLYKRAFSCQPDLGKPVKVRLSNYSKDLINVTTMYVKVGGKTYKGKCKSKKKQNCRIESGGRKGDQSRIFALS